METKCVNLHMDPKRALYIMLFFGLILSFVGVLAMLVEYKEYTQLNSLLHSDYEYSVTTNNPIYRDSYYIFNAGINFSVSQESNVAINADILMQSREVFYTKAVAWNAKTLSTDCVAVSEGIAKTADINVGDKIISKHIVDGKIHTYTVEQILPDIITARVASGRAYSEGIIVMGPDDLYIHNISHSFVSYSNDSIEDLAREISEVPQNILYRSDEIFEVIKKLIPYLVLFIGLAVLIVVVLTTILTKEIMHNFKRLMTLGFAKKQLDVSYWKHICKGCATVIIIELGLSIVISYILGINPIMIAVSIILFFTEVVAILLSAFLQNRRMWR